MFLNCLTFCKKESDTVVLQNIRNYLAEAINNNALGERLALEDALKMCEMLRMFYASQTILITDCDEKYSADIVQLINERLLRNPTLSLYLEQLNLSVDPYQKLSEEEITTILKNSALLLSFEELFSFAQILNVVQKKDRAYFSTKYLYRLLKKIELDNERTPLELWERKDSLRRLYTLIEFQATELSDKIKCVKEYARIEKNIHKIMEILRMTDEYSSVLKMLDSIGGYSQKKLHQLYEDAFSGELGRLSLRSYACSIEKEVREKR